MTDPANETENGTAEISDDQIEELRLRMDNLAAIASPPRTVEVLRKFGVYR